MLSNVTAIITSCGDMVSRFSSYHRNAIIIATNTSGKKTNAFTFDNRTGIGKRVTMAQKTKADTGKATVLYDTMLSLNKGGREALLTISRTRTANPNDTPNSGIATRRSISMNHDTEQWK